MNYFQIGFTDEPSPHEDGAIGRIVIGDFDDAFEADLSYWSGADYRRSWSTAIEHLLGGADVSCLVTSLPEPSTANFVFTWPLYREGGTVYVQNKILFLEELGEPFQPEEPWLSIGPRNTTTEEGWEISQWETTLPDLRDYLSRQKENTG